MAWTAYGIGLRERQRKSPLKIEYRWNDPRHVEPVVAVTGGETASRYYVDIFNSATDRTIHDLEVDWDKTPFTTFIDSQTGRGAPLLNKNYPHIYRSDSIHPLERQRVYLFGYSDKVETTQNALDVMGRTNHFTIRVRGKDAAEVSQAFEYSPVHFPKVLKV